MSYLKLFGKKLAVLGLCACLVSSGVVFGAEGDAPDFYEEAETEEVSSDQAVLSDESDLKLSENGAVEAQADDNEVFAPEEAGDTNEADGVSDTISGASVSTVSEDSVSENPVSADEIPSDTEAERTARVITGFYPLSEEEALCVFSDRPSLTEVIETLPSSLTVSFLDGGDSEAIPVSWKANCEDYENSDDFYFQFDPLWDENLYTLSDGADSLSLPYVGVMVESSFSLTPVYGVSSDEMSVSASYSNEETVLRYLLSEMGLCQAAACGVLANIRAESGFNPNIWGDNGQSYGICQWNTTRFDNLKNFCNTKKLDYTTIEGQLAFLNHELSGNYSAVLSVLKSVTNDGTGAYQAGYSFCEGFEIPADKKIRADERGKLARDTYFPKYKNYSTGSASGSGDNSSPENPSEQTPAGDTFYLPAKGTVDLSTFVTEFTPKKWKSSASKYASVSKKGKVTAKKATSSPVTITAYSSGGDGKTKVFTVYVETPKLTGNKTIRITDTFMMSSRLTGLSKVVPKSYSSSEPGVLYVNESTGEISVGGNGTAKITTFFEYGKYVTTFKVKVPKIKQTSIRVKNGKSKKLTIQNKHKSVVLSYDVVNPQIASVDEKGKVHGISSGTTTVRLYVNHSSEPYDTCEVIVP